VATKPKIIATPSRGNYTVKGTPKGITIPKAPAAGSVVAGKQGVDWVYRPGGPQGAGYYKKAKPTPSIAGSTTGSNAAGATIQTPTVSSAPTASTTTTVTTPGTPPNAAWWQGQYTSDPSFLLTDPVLRAAQNQTGSNYGYVINRDVTDGSPTKGQAYYRAPKIDPVTKKPVLDETGKPVYLATGILQTFDDAGKPVYKDSAGNVYKPADLEMEINRIAKGQEGYLEGALGAAEATSEKNQFGIGDVAARAGARRSGMRGQASAAETGALQSALAGLTGKAAGELTGIDKQYADLYSAIFKGLAPQAAALAAPTTTEVPVAPAAPTPEAPVAPTYDGAPTDQTSYAGYGQPKTGSPLSQGPNGEFMKMINGIVQPTAAGGGTYGWKDQVTSLEQMKKTYSLTPNQIKFIDDKIDALKKANAKTSNTTIPPAKPKPKPAKGKGK
jgi:hypothetical protein